MSQAPMWADDSPFRLGCQGEAGGFRRPIEPDSLGVIRVADADVAEEQRCRWDRRRQCVNSGSNLDVS